MAVSVGQADWSLHRKGIIDQQRHKEKIHEAIRGNLGEIVSSGDIITSDGKQTVKVPMRSLEQYKFRFDPNKGPKIGQGSGNTKVGQSLGKARQSGKNPGGGEAGDEPGVDWMETEVHIDELAEILFQDLGLPRLDPKKEDSLETAHFEFRDIRNHGLRGNIDIKRTCVRNIRRNAMKGERRPRVHGLRQEDLRYKVPEDVVKKQSSAAVIAMMDVSGSMGEIEKFIARSFFFWGVRFLRTKYDNVEIVFLAHHTEAKEVSEHDFFNRRESGGTRISPVLGLAKKIIVERFPNHNTYPFYFGDGDNTFSDKAKTTEFFQELAKMCNQVCVGQIDTSALRSNLAAELREAITDENFLVSVLRGKEDILPTIRKFFKKDGVV